MSTAAAIPSVRAQHGDDAIIAMLERISRLLRVDGAALTVWTDGGPQLIAATGAVFERIAALSALQRKAHAAPAPLVIADTTRDTSLGLGTDGGVRFFAGIPIPGDADRPPLLLSLCDGAPRSRAMAYQLAMLATDVTRGAIISRQAARVAHLKAQVEQARRQFDRASATASIGMWECDLIDNNRLTWTDGVYDLFEVPRGAPVEREATVRFYTDASRKEMEAARAKAIAEGSNFSVDAEIITAKGNRRWMRLTGTVESHNGVATRIFGMKQNITEEKLLADRTRYLAEFDAMTGLANRSQFQLLLDDLHGLAHGRPIGALLLVDLDGFKQINDTYGHARGDDCLKEVATCLTKCCGDAELIARIGGDEFAVLLGANMPPRAVEALADSIVASIGHPVTGVGRDTLHLGASVGVAHHGGGSAEDLFRQADTALYAAKGAGRNTCRVFVHPEP